MNPAFSYVNYRLSMILGKDDMNRVSLKSEDAICITVDVHGLKCSEARRLINNIINTVRVAFRLIVIHGYNHGTAIKEMLTQNFCNTHIAEKHSDPYNQGVTHMLIVA